MERIAAGAVAVGMIETECRCMTLGELAFFGWFDCIYVVFLLDLIVISSTSLGIISVYSYT